ncbi:hypothetical protein Vadar_033815 [Vaccinium darrowii]|uniref:Uncharacterized protein n=1 Tax=Vaccinium darrowii TaxID=229202 RepID=A0ACB7Z8V4_9ERIC|nr:hypothetical protein Vadar_033815 [Vaccinium darrowii]
MVNDISESFNNTIKKVRDKPILTMLKSLRRYIMQRVNPEDFVHPYYHTETFKKSYNYLINPIPDKSTWPRTKYEDILPLEIRRKAGRPKKARRKGEDARNNLSQSERRKRGREEESDNVTITRRPIDLGITSVGRGKTTVGKGKGIGGRGNGSANSQPTGDGNGGATRVITRGWKGVPSGVRRGRVGVEEGEWDCQPMEGEGEGLTWHGRIVWLRSACVGGSQQGLKIATMGRSQQGLKTATVGGSQQGLKTAPVGGSKPGGS